MVDSTHWKPFEKVLLKVRQETATVPEVVKGKPFPSVLDLLLLANEQIYYNGLIIKLMKLLAKVEGREYRDKNEQCRNWFYVCSSALVLISHRKVGLENDSVQITMPTLDKNIQKFENYAAKRFSMFVLYLDLESLVVPVATDKIEPAFWSTSALEHYLR